MSKKNFYSLLQSEIGRLDNLSASKRHEVIISGFTQDPSPKAIIDGKPYLIFNSNDYLGLRFHPTLKSAESQATEKFGTGPGAVRFISGTLAVHAQLEQAIAAFHKREAAIIFSSAFSANLAALFSLIKGQTKDSLVSSEVVVISDELNHRSIVEGIRLANLSPEQKLVFRHLDLAHLDQLLSENKSKFKRSLVVTDGVFSMLGQYQDLAQMTKIIERYDSEYPEGVLLFVDDCHGIGVVGETGRGVEEVFHSPSDILVGTLGKAFGCDGGYVVGNAALISYLRESAATYIYSNPISAGTAAAALAAVQLVDSPAGQQLLSQSRANIQTFKQQMISHGFKFAAGSTHAIQPLLVGDAAKTLSLKQSLFDQGILVTNINYPVVPRGSDEIRVQISAIHTKEDLDQFITACTSVAKSLGLI